MGKIREYGALRLSEHANPGIRRWRTDHVSNTSEFLTKVTSPSRSLFDPNPNPRSKKSRREFSRNFELIFHFLTYRHGNVLLG